MIRTTLHQYLPSLVQQHPQGLLVLPEINLCDVYDVSMQLGIIQKHRAINDRIRREYFEKLTGMVVTPPSKWPSLKTMVIHDDTLCTYPKVLEKRDCDQEGAGIKDKAAGSTKKNQENIS